jgi:hypothetical protein
MRSLTSKQIAILTAVVKMNTDGSFLDFDQLVEALGKTEVYEYKAPSKDALAFSIRYMIGHGLIEKKDTERRRGAERRIIAPTMLGYAEYKELQNP